MGAFVGFDPLMVIGCVMFYAAPGVFHLPANHAEVLALGLIIVSVPFAHRIISRLSTVVYKTDLDKELVLLNFS